MASPGSSQVLDTSALAAGVAEELTYALQDGLVKLFMYQRGGVYSVKRSLSEAALTQALQQRQEALEAQVQAYMGEGLYRLITQQPRPAGFAEWSEFSGEYRRKVVRPAAPYMRKVRQWLTANGYRSYRDYQRDRAYTNQLTGGEAEAVLRRLRRGTRSPRYDKNGFRPREGTPLTGTYTLPGDYRGAKGDLVTALERQRKVTRYARHKELLQDRLNRLRRSSGELLSKPYGFQSGAFAERFRDLPVSLTLRLGASNQGLRAQVRATARRLTAANAARQAQGEGGIGLSEARNLVTPSMKLAWGPPKRLPASMDALLHGRWSRFATPAFPLYDQGYAAAALRAALRKVFGGEP